MESQLNGVSPASSRKVPCWSGESSGVVWSTGIRLRWTHGGTNARSASIFFVGSEVSPVFLVPSYREWKVSVLCCLTVSFGYLRSVGSLSGTHSTRHRAVFSWKKDPFTAYWASKTWKVRVPSTATTAGVCVQFTAVMPRDTVCHMWVTCRSLS